MDHGIATAIKMMIISADLVTNPVTKGDLYKVESGLQSAWTKRALSCRTLPDVVLSL